MKKILVVGLFVLMASPVLRAQVEGVESVDTTIVNLRNELQEPLLPVQSELPNTSVHDLPEVTAVPLEIPELQWRGIPQMKTPTLPHWTTGFITGYHSTQSDMMLGGINSAGAAVYQSFGRYWMASVGVDVNKYGVLYNTATMNASLSYRPTQNFGITVFGSYMPGTFMSAMSVGPAWNLGGYVSLETDNGWGVDLGVQHGYDAMYGGYNAPIVRPYYNLHGAKLGIDLGPLLQNLLKKSNKSSPQFNPVMPRPVHVLPPVAPRR